MSHTSTKSRAIVWSVALLASAITGLTLMGCTNLHSVSPEHFNPLAFDWIVRSRPDRGIDPRLLVVTITESDIRAAKQWPLPDGVLARALEELEKHQPKVIGLDLYCDLPVEPGSKELVLALEKPNVIAVTYLSNTHSLGVPPPPSVPKQRVGFSNLAIDPDGVVRRNWLFATDNIGKNVYSFSLRLALSYLQAQGILLKPSTTHPQHMQLGKAVFTRLQAYSVENQTIDARGYQIPLYYRSATNVAQQVTLAEVLNGTIDPSWVKDKIVLIGPTAPSLKDYYSTPYSFADQEKKMPGIMIHAQMVSQILSTVLDTGSQP